MCISVLVLVLLIAKISITQITLAFSSVKPAWLIVAGLLLIPNILVQVWKWYYLLKWVKKDVSFPAAFRSLIIGYPLGFITPGRVGDVGRAFFVQEIPHKLALKLAILDKLTNLIVVLFIGAIAILMLDIPTVPAAVTSILYILIFLLMVLVFAVCVSNQLQNKLRHLLNNQQINSSRLLVTFSCSLIFTFIFYTQLSLLAYGFSQLNIFAAYTASAAAMMAKTVLPIAFADLGIRESAVIYFFGRIGLEPAAAFYAALLLFLINVALPALLAIPLLLQTKKRTMQP